MLFMEASALNRLNVHAAFKLLVAEVMHQADTLASQPPAFEHKLKVTPALLAVPPVCGHLSSQLSVSVMHAPFSVANPLPHPDRSHLIPPPLPSPIASHLTTPRPTTSHRIPLHHPSPRS